MTTQALTLVAVHLPKTAGTSFRAAMRVAYGDRLQLDYDDRPLSHSRTERRRQALVAGLCLAGRRLPSAAIYGHFLPLKYAWARRTAFAVWLRDPVQRVASRYQHYLRAGAAGISRHARWGLRPGLSLEQFVSLPQYHNTYSEYFWGFALSRFAFIGFSDNYAADLERFSRTFGLPAALPEVRENAHASDAHHRHVIDPDSEALIRRYNAADIALYARARQLPAAQPRS